MSGYHVALVYRDDHSRTFCSLDTEIISRVIESHGIDPALASQIHQAILQALDQKARRVEGPPAKPQSGPKE